jgi:hypothetical protein
MAGKAPVGSESTDDSLREFDTAPEIFLFDALMAHV